MYYTAENIARQLIDSSTSLDLGYIENYSYYLHHDGQKFVPEIYSAEHTFQWPVPYIDDIQQRCRELYPNDDEAATAQFWNEVKKTETLSNPGFREVCEGLAAEINAWLKENQ